MADGVDDDLLELLCSGGGGNPGAYAAGLKRKLDFYCTAKSMEAKSQESSLGYSNSQASGTSELTSQASFDVEQTGDGGWASLVTNSNVIHTGHDDYQGKPTNSGTSKQQSDGGVNLDEKVDLANANKMRRMMLNRESARRSRKRRESRLCDLESQVSTLTSANKSLLKRMADMTQKYNDATLDNRNLIIAVETMRTKVNIAEEAVKKLSGTTFLLSSTSQLPPSMTLSSFASDTASTDVVIEDSIEHFLQATLHDDQNKPALPNAAIPFDKWGVGHHVGLSVMGCMLGEPAEEQQ